MNEIQNLPWTRVREWAEKELEDLRKKLERPDQAHDQTQVTRGEIRALKKLLELPVTLAPQQSTTPFPGFPGSGDS